MSRARQFDRDEALHSLMQLFWDRGFAATSTSAITDHLGVGRQSVYNAFGDKRAMYLEALERYQDDSTSRRCERLQAASSPMDGIAELLSGVIDADPIARARGCFGVGSIAEFGASDPDVTRMRERFTERMRGAIEGRVDAAKLAGEISRDADTATVAQFILMTMTGLQLSARAGADEASLRRMARFTTDLLTGEGAAATP